jgi:ribosomal subunit interface protein
MYFPVQITIRDIPPTDSITAHIKKKCEKLQHYFDRITACRIIVSLPQKNQHQGKLYNVRIELSVPKEEITVTRIKDENLFVAIRQAFSAATRRLRNYVRKLRGDIKSHEGLTHGLVARLYPEEEIGFIETADGREYYFHRNNVVYPDFDRLSVGTEVQFIEISAGEGLQANRISAGKHHTLAT